MATRATALAMRAPSGTRTGGYRGGAKAGRVVQNQRKPIEGDMSWQAEGRCQQSDTNLFYPEAGGNAKVKAAKAVCKLCPVMNKCLDFALSVSAIDDWGVWGGTTKDEREPMRRALNAKPEVA